MKNLKLDWPVLALSGGFLLLFIIASIVNAGFVGNLVNTGFAWSSLNFGAFWQVLMIVTFIIAVFMSLTELGTVRLGDSLKPKFSYFKWFSMIMITLLAGGGVFWAAAEPMYHYLDTPPMFTEMGAEATDVQAGLSAGFLHWGFLAWSILGTLGVVVLMYARKKGQPLKPRTLLYPIFGEKIMKKSVLGTSIDVFSILAACAGTIGPIGFLGLQAGYGLNMLFGLPDTFAIQFAMIFFLVGIAAVSAATGINKGIQWLSSFNVIVTVILAASILILGPARFIIDSFVSSYGSYLQNFLPMSLYRGDEGWLSGWTIFFWGWFIGYGPIMAIFISRISDGRTIRELFLTVAFLAPVVTNFWFTVVGGTGIFFEMNDPGSVSNMLNEGGLPASIFAIVNQLPLGAIFAFLFIFVTCVFVATTADSISYSISMIITGLETPHKSIRIFWALAFGAVAAVLLYIGEGSIDSLQSFIVITAVPVSLVMLPTLWLAPLTAKKLLKEQKRSQEKL
ncbi:choline-glycine betaine transporter [Alkalihalobacillus xiaoxiensis]|uniref:Choline-glycine betaine transporter n=1 Tax=Shouchella xiaoxiensis TaxID=766895 RepID=A0ABS2SWW7_9BACI|nr:BCCT family transporter [Shouchella xiaoxiensis]MBM7839998.1 choline-glycine betaine transporter [Shouchella xiaoxiensis]